MSIQFRVFRDEEPEQPKEGDVIIREEEILYYKTGKWHPWILPPGTNSSKALAIHTIWLSWKVEEARISSVSAWSSSDGAEKRGYHRALKEAQQFLKMAMDL